MTKRLRFHWSLSSAGAKWKGAVPRARQSGVLDREAHVEFCRHAERCQIESLLTAVGFHRPDPITLAAWLGAQTEFIKFMVAVRSGIFSPTVFVQQVNTIAALTGGRICLNVVCGHTPNEQRGYGDFLSHDERYERAGEFLSVCRYFWQGETAVDFHGKYYQIENGRLNIPFDGGRLAEPGSFAGPEIYVGGASESAMQLAIEHASCLLTPPDAPRKLRDRVRPVLDSGTEVGLLVSLIARETRDEAVQAGYRMLRDIGEPARTTHTDFRTNSDSVGFSSTLQLAEQNASDWLSPHLWTAAVSYLGAPAIAIVGSYDDVAEAILEFQEVGVTQFLFMGWPDLDEMLHFSREVLPRVRARESPVESS